MRRQIQVVAHHHDGFWLDVSTLRNFYDINLSLANANAPLSVEDIHKGIISRGVCPLHLSCSDALGMADPQLLVASSC